MDHLFRLELVKILTLLYRESEHSMTDTGSDYIIKKALSFMPVFETNESYADSMTALRQLVEYYIIEGATNGINKEDILQRVRLAVKEDSSTYEALKAGIDVDTNLEEAQKVCSRIKGELNIFISKAAIKDICKSAYRKLSFEEEKINWNTFTREMINELESHCDLNSSPTHESFLGAIDLNDEIAIKTALKEGTNSLSGDGIMRTGWQGLNKCLTGDYVEGK